MIYSELGRTGLNVSRCCLGTMTWGKQNTQDEGFEQMDYAISRGINFFDVAEMYAIPPTAETYGTTETIIGNWFAARGNRQDVILASKILGRSDAVHARPGMGVDQCRQTPAQIDLAVEQSLKRLQTDYIDLYQLHWPDRKAPIFSRKPSITEMRDDDMEPLADILMSLQRHVEKGNIRHIGVSNETPWGVMKFIAESEAKGLPRMASIQNVYSLVARQFEEGLDEVCMREDVSMLSYSPLAQGYLTGKYRNGALPPGARKTLFNRLDRYETSRGQASINAHVALAEELGVDPAQFAIRFCDTRDFMTSTIIGATTMDQLKTCIDAFSIDWTDEMEQRVGQLYAEYRGPCT
ncbi:MAG: aldo/keto reductase [Hirschia sp.]|nr:aldo/keto reductase [Hirschia sp.]MBF19253.1 aldo/keto reductase [Hirschia sp.]